LELGENTTWCTPVISDWSIWKAFDFNRQNQWWTILENMTRDMVNDAKGDYFVSITDIHPGVDSLVALRGPESLCIDLYDNPQTVKKAILNIWEPFKEMYEIIFNLTSENLAGSSNWMGVWHPGKMHTVSADFMCMVSNDMFEEFMLPEIEEEVKWLDASIFHLDGPDTLRHLDALLDNHRPLVAP